MLEQNKVLEFTATPSFCNSWPEISVEANGVVLWQGIVDHVQRFRLSMDIQDHNQVYIRYLNKRKGPVIWDTVTDHTGKIVEDQYCIISEIYIARSRCDFLISELAFHGEDGTVERTFGFMSQRGHLLIEFPGDVYSWILNRRQQQMLGTRQGSSALDYWTNYIIDSTDADQAIIKEIKQLLNNDKNTGN
jgi:hypothetical protein